jgi:hypothetical protein
VPELKQVRIDSMEALMGNIRMVVKFGCRCSPPHVEIFLAIGGYGFCLFNGSGLEPSKI